MTFPQRYDQLLQKHLAGVLTTEEVVELREILETDPQALDRYLDLCELDEQLLAKADLIASPSGTLSAAASTSRATEYSGLMLTRLFVVACVIVVVGLVVRQQMFPSSNAVMVVARNDDASPSQVSNQESNPTSRRTPNPRKVINASGSMKHPGLSEASIPVVPAAAKQRIKFNRDIRPILSETCFLCHGPDDHGRRADLRLDTHEGATADLGGYTPIAPGDLSNSEVWKRIISDDPELLMPPPESHLVLTEVQKTLIRRWIEEGAPYEGHWAFIPPVSPPVPEVNLTDEVTQERWGRNAIDSFVAQGLVNAGLTPSPEANARTLIRRLTFDLTGLPPTMEQADAFARDYPKGGERVYQDAISRLLESPHFGERMALPWLDQSRYADTNGYSIDGGRSMWMWRDWVIQSYNDNMPYDQFLIEQIAGDLLPAATDAQRIATGFNRNHMITHEGGTIPAENLANYAADRVKTTSEVFLGLTMGCAQCHDHKYDPISQKEYYQFLAFFNELDDHGLDGDGGRNSGPTLNAVTVLKTQELDDIDVEIARLRDRLSQATNGFDEWLETQRSDEESRGDGFRLVDLELIDVSSPNRPGPITFETDGSVQLTRPSGGLNGLSHSLRLPTGALDEAELVSGIRIQFLPQKTGDGDASRMSLSPFPAGVPKISTVLVSATAQPADQVDYHRQLAFSKVSASSQAAGHAAASIVVEDSRQWWQPSVGDSAQRLTLTFAEPVDPRETPYLSVLIFFGQPNSLAFQWKMQPFSGKDTDSRWDAPIAQAIATPEEQWDDTTRDLVLNVFRKSARELEPLRVRIANLEERRDVLTSAHSTMVMNTSANPRETFVLNRGQYDSPLERVTAQTPGVLPQLIPASAPEPTDSESAELAESRDAKANRLDLANWLVAADHPLTSRVAVNRFWSLFLGTGLVATSADFGSQGEYPSHPELLDYLATRFVEIGWDSKQLIREIVSSATYRQQSSATQEQIELDPKNRLLGRGPRFRLPAEFIRDQALAVSGLLAPRVGGPSVQPYQPPALWKEVSHFGSTPATKQVFVQDHGEKLYRRSLYTIVKRTSPHPAMAAFDAPSREMCTVDRGATNTPIQALVTLNDPQFTEAARVLSAAILREQPDNETDSRIEYAFSRVLNRSPSKRELQVVGKLVQSELARFAAAPDEAAAAISVGESPPSNDIDVVEQAAWMQVSTLLLNLSETLTRG
ncbi:hypothetical protein FHS27_004306 [Rhodopirellula rubra]|uniref:Planctomycete cytochrome C n=1 Tax=Aporhodopirellula rubra TaxID=980271 RepID=A0A7W5H6E8_9BACT|nr:PSD1 and planctomycete cytochrome C domain-containing protein [Aporhodopirellula rubra]MBB3208477.1 hypothetical protein [Aporhodopirellula rubra]